MSGTVQASGVGGGGAARNAALRALALHPLVDSVNVAGRILDASGYQRSTCPNGLSLDLDHARRRSGQLFGSGHDTGTPRAAPGVRDPRVLPLTDADLLR